MGLASSAKPVHTWMWKESSFSDAVECTVALYPDRLVWYRNRFSAESAGSSMGGPGLRERGGDAHRQSRSTFLKEGPPGPTPQSILEEILERLGGDPALAARWSLA